MIPSRFAKILPMAFTAFSLTACATYVPASVSELPIGGPVRIQVSRQAYTALPQISDLPGNWFAGTLLRRSDSELVVHVPIALGSPLGQDVNIPMSGVVVGEVRSVSRVRTALAIGLGLGIVTGVIMSSRHSGPLSEPLQDNHDPDAAFRGMIARALSLSIPLP